MEYDDYYEYDYDCEDDLYTWRTGQGQLILICDMDDDHLANTIRYLENSAEHSAKLNAMKFELLERQKKMKTLEQIFMEAK